MRRDAMVAVIPKVQDTEVPELITKGMKEATRKFETGASCGDVVNLNTY